MDTVSANPARKLSPVRNIRDLRDLLWSSIDAHAAKGATTVYTGVRNFPMLPELLFTGITSLLEAEDKMSIVIEFIVGSDGSVHSSSDYRTIVRNKAQLTYNIVGACVENKSGAPDKVAVWKTAEALATNWVEVWK